MSRNLPMGLKDRLENRISVDIDNVSRVNILLRHVNKSCSVYLLYRLISENKRTDPVDHLKNWISVIIENVLLVNIIFLKYVDLSLNELKWNFG